jgi:Uma2 family endonuclease
MATKALLTIEQYAALEEPAGRHYELSDGELIVTPSANFFHNDMRDHLTASLRSFLVAHPYGRVISELDMQLGTETVRRPDVAFVRSERLKDVDLRKVPFPIAPDIVIEIVSDNDRADDLNLKVSQYLQAGVQSVWLFYPITKLAYRYVAGKRDPEVRSAEAGDQFEETELLHGFSLPLTQILK